MSKLLSRAEILNAEDLKKDRVEVPEWGGHVYVRTLSADERDQWEIEQQDNPKESIRARLAAYTVCDEVGNPIFSAADIEALGAKSGAALGRIWDASLKLNKVSKEDVEELEKN